MKAKSPVKRVAWSLQPDCLITRGAIETPEQYIPGKPPKGAWESYFTMGTQWQYKPTNENYKSGTKIIEMLIETRAKGGSLLLNVGPMPDGRIPIEQESRLREAALWMAVNNKAIYNTRPWTVTNEENIWFTKSKDSERRLRLSDRHPRLGTRQAARVPAPIRCRHRRHRSQRARPIGTCRRIYAGRGCHVALYSNTRLALDLGRPCPATL